MALFLKILIISCLWLHNMNVESAPRIPRLTLAEPYSNYYFNNVGGYPDTYNFGYEVSDPNTGNIQYRNEERYPNGTVIGVYGYMDPLGKTQNYQYEADSNGYRVKNGGPRRDKFEIVNVQKASTESSVTWTRPYKKKKKTQAKPNVLTPFVNNKQYFELKPPSYYAIQ